VMKINKLNISAITIIFLTLFSLACVFIPTAALANPNLIGPSGLIYAPSAYTSGGVGYYALSDNRITKVNLVFMGGALEGGVIHNKLMSNYSFNLKLPVLEEDDYIPQLALGLYNYKNATIGTTNYIVLSKHIGSLGVTLHAGYKRNGGLKDAAGLFNYQTIQAAIDDYNGNAGNTFMGVEYSFLPMFSLMGEQFEKSVNAGIRFRPMPSLTIDYDVLDVKKNKNFKENRVINFNFSLGF
jgi:hypothetical protein